MVVQICDRILVWALSYCVCLATMLCANLHNYAINVAVMHTKLAGSHCDCLYVQIRTQLANEMIDDLKDIAEENALLMRESITSMFSLEQVVEHPLEPKPDQEAV